MTYHFSSKFCFQTDLSIAVILGFGAFVHISNILGLSGKPWRETSIVWQMLDIVLLIFNIVVGIALWRKKAWSVLAFVGGLLLFQFIPYTFFRNYFASTPEEHQTLNGLLGTLGLLIG